MCHICYFQCNFQESDIKTVSNQNVEFCYFVTDQYDALVTCGCINPGNIEINVVKELCRIVKPGNISILY